jgi:Protein of unknown function (DUF1559)
MSNMARSDSDDLRPRKKKRTKQQSGPGILKIILIAGSVFFALAVAGVLVRIVLNRPRKNPFDGMTHTEQLESANTEAEQKNFSSNNLRQMGLALENYSLVNQAFPPTNLANADGSLQTTMGVAMLPYIGQAPLYNSIIANGSLSSPQNQTLLMQSLLSWKNPAISNSPAGNDSHYAGNLHVFPEGKSITLSEVSDGLSNTLAIGEVSAGFKAWHAKDNTRDPSLGFGSAPEKFGSPFDGGVHFSLLDGSVKFVSDKIDPQLLKAIATPAGGEAVSDF